MAITGKAIIINPATGLQALVKADDQLLVDRLESLDPLNTLIIGSLSDVAIGKEGNLTTVKSDLLLGRVLGDPTGNRYISLEGKADAGAVADTLFIKGAPGTTALGNQIGGSVIIQTGGGVGGNANGGSLFLTTGLPSGTGVDGDILIGQTPLPLNSAFAGAITLQTAFESLSMAPTRTGINSMNLVLKTEVHFGEMGSDANIDFVGSVPLGASGSRIVSDMLFRKQAGTITVGFIDDFASTETAADGDIGTSIIIKSQDASRGGLFAGPPANGGDTYIKSGMGGRAIGVGQPAGYSGSIYITPSAGAPSIVNMWAGSGGGVVVQGGSGGIDNFNQGGNMGGSVDITGGTSTGNYPGADVNIYGGQPDDPNGNGGNVSINGGYAQNPLFYGQVIIGGSVTSSVHIGDATNYVSFAPSDAIPVLSFAGTATINLPGVTGLALNNFQINGAPVTDTVTAAALSTLTAGPTSNASVYHKHNDVTSASFVMTANVGFGAGALVGSAYSTTLAPNGPALVLVNPAADLALDTTPFPAGFIAAPVNAGDPATVQTSGAILIDMGYWEWNVLPNSPLQIGAPVFASDLNQGLVTLTPTATDGSWKTRVGYLQSYTATDATITISIGDPIKL